MHHARCLAGFLLLLMPPFAPAHAVNWVEALGAVPEGSGPSLQVHGFIQPEIQATENSKLVAGPWAGQRMNANLMRPEFRNPVDINVARFRPGIRGRLVDGVNYRAVMELGYNAATRWESYPLLLDAYLTFTSTPLAKLRIGQFKTPISEEAQQPYHYFINFANVSNLLLQEFFFKNDGSDPARRNEPTGAISSYRDVGLEAFDSYRAGDWELSWAAMIGNGNGIQRWDNDGNQDFYLFGATEYLFGGSQGPYREGLKFFGWYQHGQRFLDTASGRDEFERERWGGGFTLRQGPWRSTMEYAGGDGMIFAGTDGAARNGARSNDRIQVASFNVQPEESAFGFLTEVGYRLTPEWELEARYDEYTSGTRIEANERFFRTVTLGAQYFYTPQSHVTFNYEFRSADAPNLAGASTVNRNLDQLDDRISMQVFHAFSF
ncbi:MAG TPA: hypothetical protein VI457_15125 [Methylococcaceae bacterium]|nr:hypothetical protein [Methylococcaceae bacterium]